MAKSRQAVAITLFLGLGLTGPEVLAVQDPAQVAAEILDEKRPAAIRQQRVAENPAISAELIAAMTADLKPGTSEEYRRIPWIWRVAIAAGKRNDAAELRKILEVSLPASGAPLDDWRAVVIGGGLINGVSLIDEWPAARFEEILKGHSALHARWTRALEQAASMADDPKVKNGTRYDALRMLGVEPWDRRGVQLQRYLAKGVDNELQQGAVSGLSDVANPSGDVARALISAFPHLSPGNRNFALDALLRDSGRCLALLDAVADGRITPSQLGPERVADLKNHVKAAVRVRARKLLGRI